MNCRHLLSQQVSQRSDAAYTPSLVHEIRQGRTQEMSAEIEKLKTELTESQTQKTEKLRDLEMQYGQIIKGKDARFEDEIRQMSSKYEEEIRVLKEELRLLRIRHEEMKEEYERETVDLKHKMKEFYYDQQKHEERWKSKESQWIIQRTQLEGDLRAAYNELLEFQYIWRRHSTIKAKSKREDSGVIDDSPSNSQIFSPANSGNVNIDVLLFV